MVVTVALAAGCSGKPAAAPASTPPSPVGEALPHSGAPKVDHPLPESVLSGDPCQGALTPDQLKQILGTAPQGKPDSTAGLGPDCDWHADAAVSVSYTTQDHQGLSAAYKNAKPKVTLWRVLPPIQGFPAVGYADKQGEKTGDICTVSVGVADDLSFNATLQLSYAKRGKADPCELAARVADMVVTNLRQKAGS
ncbi:DUF3558 domain-containing protein [Amycolatopsis sp. NBC_00345]|uniref:DUF3558 domain-containing protein n=1 Tax=Amycolatopsis sp. NBC_00345 TaxID=2975955 RepID=UPI002E2690E3